MLSRDQVIKQLARVRYLYQVGSREVDGPFPSLSALSFHDAVEMFLLHGIEHRGGDILIKDTVFDLFDKLAISVPGLEGRNRLKPLNDARQSVKHKGQEISREEATRCQSRAQSFFEDNCPQVFDADFFAFSMADAIKRDDVREHIKAAEIALADGRHEDSVKELTIAFEILSRERGLISTSWHVPRLGDRTFDDVIRKAASAIARLETTLALQTVGIAYKRFIQFRRLAPQVHARGDGGHSFTGLSDYTPEICRFCIDFAADAALGLERLDREQGSFQDAEFGRLTITAAPRRDQP